MGNIKIYKSSAGSGKTYTLVKDYLGIILSSPNEFMHTLAVTFTNKSTEEMKTRIIKALAELAQGKNESLRKALETETGLDDIQIRSKYTLSNILHNFSNFSVTTIDSFFSRILRSFSKEIKLNIGYELELEDKDIIEKSVDELLDEASENEKLTKYLLEYLEKNMDDEKGWKIDTIIKDYAREITKERYKEISGEAISDEAMSKAINNIKTVKYSFENRMEKYSDEANKIITDFNLSPVEFKQGINGVWKYLTYYLPKKIYTPNKTSEKAFIDKNELYGKKGRMDVLKKALDSGLEENMQNIYSDYKKNFIEYNTANHILKTIYIIAVFNDIKRKLAEYRNENKILFMSDVNTILEKIISEENSPFIYERTGNKYKHFLIDEFQDTSYFQWNNFFPLLLNSISENNQVLIVGDVKQSIYRWRGGNMDLLGGKIITDFGLHKGSIDIKNLGTNYRSGEEIINFNNRFFTNALKKLEQYINEEFPGEDLSGFLGKLKNDYDNLEQKVLDEKKGLGFVNITFVNTTKTEDESESEDKSEITKRIILEKIKEAADDGYDLKDITVLVRRAVDGVNAANLLASNNIDVISSESLLLNNSPKIKLIVSALKYISDTKNELYGSELLFHYLTYINKHGTEIDLNNIFEDIKINSRKLFYEFIPGGFFKEKDKSKLNPSLINKTIYELIETLIKIFNLNDASDAFLLKLQDAVSEYSKKGNADVISFLDWWNEKGGQLSIIIPEGLNAVRIMTIHKAKGLQNKVIIIPYTNWMLNVNTKKELIWVSTDKKPFEKIDPYVVKANKDLMITYFKKDYISEYVQSMEDNFNLLYVAFTRAKERLYAIVPQKNNSIFKLINETMNENETNGIAEGNVQTFTYGEKRKITGKNENDNSGYYNSYISNNWYKKIIIKPKFNKIKVFREKEFSSKTQWGVLTHLALSYINKSVDIKDAVNTLLYEGLITEQEKSVLKTKLEEVFRDEIIKSWFDEDWEVKAECELLLPDGKILRPDRVITKDAHAIVIDYKTGGKKPEHKTQVNQYAKVLSQMGYSEIKKYLLYLNESDNEDQANKYQIEEVK